ncbi:MAG: helix-turn-helix domain-containing protein [Anaerolineales bacterium]|nr:helix-turn-helix domain-containing protein [Anaerolineales bacterium]
MTSSDARLLRAKILGARIRQIRDRLRYSIKDAAEIIGVSSGVFSSYENGKKAVSLPELELLAVNFNMSLSAFFGKSDPETSDQKLQPDHLIPLRQRMIGANLRTRREELEISLRDVSREAKIPASRLSAYERGQKPIPLPELEVIVSCLGQSIEDYFDTHGRIAEELGFQSQLVSFQSLPEELRTFVLDPESLPYLRLAHSLSSLSTEDLKALGEGMVKLSR